MDGKIWLRVIAALVLVAAVAGITFFAYNAGVAQGSPITIQSPSGQTGQPPYPYYGFGYPFHRPWGFGFGFLGCLAPLFLFFLIFGAFRFLLWGPRWGHMHRGYWGRGGGSETGVPPMFDEWHKRAHGQEPSQENKP